MALLALSLALTSSTGAVEESSKMKGMSFVGWWYGCYETLDSNQSLELLPGIGVEWVSILATWYTDNKSSTEIYPDPDMTPTDEGVVIAIRKAHELGLKVMLKPHVDPVSGEWRGEIEFEDEADWELWFDNYTAFIVHYAQIAEQESVELFCIGCEYCLTVSRPEWLDVIQAVRSVYHGPLTYASNYDNYVNVMFWDYVDYIGIDAYFELTNDNDSSLEELIAAWNGHADDVEEWWASNYPDKEILFTEIGYRSIDGANARPWDWWSDGEVDLEEQAMCYEAFFETAWKRSWLKGVFWWAWEAYPDQGGPYDTNYTPHGKLAEDVIRQYFLEEETTTPTSTATTTPPESTTYAPSALGALPALPVAVAVLLRRKRK